MSYLESYTQSHMKRLLHNCCNMELRQTVSHNFGYILNYDMLCSEDGDSRLFVSETSVFTHESSWRYNPED
jgi:hypothetical protein